MPYNIDGIYDISLIEYNTTDSIKYNTTRKLYNLIDTGHIYTLDTSDNINYDNTILKKYLNSKANYLIQPYNRCQLKVSKFNNEKSKFKQPAVIYRDISCTTSIDISLNQRTIQRQNRVESSLYTMNLAALSSTQQTNQQLNSKYAHNQSDRKYQENNKVGVDIKHNSYDRYLAKKKSGYLTSKIPNTKPLQLTGNKYYKLGLIANKHCKC